MGESEQDYLCQLLRKDHYSSCYSKADEVTECFLHYVVGKERLHHRDVMQKKSEIYTGCRALNHFKKRTRLWA